jgi:hypothetical protein
MSDLVADALGWAGAGAVVVAYALVSAGRVGGRAVGYQLLNLAGSGCLIVHTAHRTAYASLAVNVVWAAVAAITLARGVGPVQQGQPTPPEAP